MDQIKQQMHIGVYGLMEQNSKILVVHKSRGPYTGLVDLPGGRPQHGESIEETLRREFLEETGVTLNTFSLFKNQTFLVPYTNEKGERCEFYHIALLYRIDKAELANFDAKIEKEDVQGASWIPRQELSKENSSPLLLGALYNVES